MLPSVTAYISQADGLERLLDELVIFFLNVNVGIPLNSTTQSDFITSKDSLQQQ